LVRPDPEPAARVSSWTETEDSTPSLQKYHVFSFADATLWPILRGEHPA
jgi:hypothetical protein